MNERRHSGGGRGILVALVALVAAVAWAIPAQANVTLPADNGKIAFASDRDAPAEPGPAPTFRAGDDTCYTPSPETFGGSDSPPIYEDNNCWFDVFTTNPDGSGVTNLTASNGGDHAYDDDPSWSPDGTKIAFASDRACAAAKAAGTNEEYCSASIYVMDANGSNVRRITAPDASQGEDDSNPTWSPNGGQIAFTRQGFERSRSGIWVVDASTSSDGRSDAASRLSFEGSDDPDAVFSLDADPAWSPDGKSIAFTRFFVGGDVPLSVGRALHAYSADRNAEALAYARKKLAAIAPQGVPTPELLSITSTIARGQLDTGVVTQVTNPDACPVFIFIPFPTSGSCQFDNHAAWTPDGNRVGFDREDVSFDGQIIGTDNPSPQLLPWGLNDNINIWDASASGGDERSFAPDPAKDCASDSEVPVPGLIPTSQVCHAEMKPAFSPDGTRFAFHSDSPDSNCYGMFFFLGDLNMCNHDVFTQSASDGSALEGGLAADRHDDRNADWQPVYKAPTTAASVPACQTNGTVTVNASANAGSYGAPKAVHYKVDGGAEQTAPVSDGNAAINVPSGSHTLEYWGENQAGAQEAAHHTATVKVDEVNNCAGDPTLSVAGVRRACVSSNLTVRVAVKTAGKVKQVRVYLDGKRIRTLKKSKFSLRINARKLKAGRHRLTVIAVDVAGHSVRSTRTIARCAQAKPKRKAAPRFTG
ncbi:MAG TPA: Ig-like domain-containing protein [Thermoleophilaceae bacterium]